jgi:hypothetical protein
MEWPNLRPRDPYWDPLSKIEFGTHFLSPANPDVQGFHLVGAEGFEPPTLSL